MIEADGERTGEKRVPAEDSRGGQVRFVWGTLCVDMMRGDGVVVVLMDERRFTRETILETLKDYFPAYRRVEASVPRGRSQTRLFNRDTEPLGERDVVLTAS